MPVAFTQETSLTRAFRAQLPEVVKQIRTTNRKAVYCQELDGLAGRPDVVVFQFQSSARGRFAAAQPLQCRSMATVYHLLKRRQRTDFEWLVNNLGWHPSTIRAALKALIAARLVQEDDAKAYHRRGPSEPFDADIWSFEIKVHDWRRALYQATRYRLFSNLSFVVLPERACSAALRHRELFLRANIGIIAITSSHEFQVQCKPRSRKSRHPVLRTMAAASILAGDIRVQPLA